MKNLKFMFFAFLLLALTPMVMAQDPGVPDTLEVIGDTIYLNQSTPIDLKIVNDDDLRAIMTGLKIDSPDSAYVRFDSAVFVNRMSDPTVFDIRVLKYVYGSTDGVFPDTLKFGGYPLTGNQLPAGNGVVARMYFTGINPGMITIDSNHVAPTIEFNFLISENYVSTKYEPQFSPVNIVVAEGAVAPLLELDSLHYECFAGDAIDIDFNGYSPVGNNVTVDYSKFSGFDSPMSPVNTPVVGSSTLTWQPTQSDIGIWEVVFDACDEYNTCVQKSITIQVLENSDYYTSLTSSHLELTTLPEDITIADIDNDGPEEIVISCYPQFASQSLLVLAYNPFDGSLNEVFGAYGGFIRFKAVSGYINKDKWLDLTCFYNDPMGRYQDVLINDGNYGFSSHPTIPNQWLGRGALLTDLNHDKYIDFVGMGKHDLNTYRGEATLNFASINSYDFTEEIISLQSQDFDFDGDNDLAIGSLDGLYIFNNDGNGNMTQKDFFPQSFEATDIGLANNGSDFDNDGNYDLYVAAPSVGGDSSLLIIYSNDGAGNYSKSYEKQVVGQVFGNVVVDFNQDGNLDIAFINGAQKYLSILYGNGNGTFTNEQRYYLDHIPANLATSDMDTDGDMDLIITTQYAYKQNYLMVYENNFDPDDVAQVAFEIIGCNNAEVELVAPNGTSLNKVKNGLSSFSSSLINIDDSDQLDNIIKASVVENGLYDLYLTPRPGLAEGAPFDLEYKIGEETFRLAQNAPMSATGYHFVIAPDGNSPVIPIPGQFIYEQPLFNWSGGGDFNFQLATDIQFTNLIFNDVISTNSFSLPEELSTEDTAMYYWRVKPVTVAEYTIINSFNLYNRVPTGVGDDLLLPDKFYLAQNYPNPFNPTTTIEFNLPRAEFVELYVYNMLGQKVATLANDRFEAGTHKLVWNGTDDLNSKVASGLYMYKLTAGDNTAMKKMILLK